ncbi:hypothetical protein OAO19_00990 [Gammaproteobacteria bacterium]|nr:hypothetical protein [Gammaproteobacteria bacterium]
MPSKNYSLPTKMQIQKHSITSLSQYWVDKEYLIEELPIKRIMINIESGTPLKLESISLPAWAIHHGIDECILVPSECVPRNYQGDKNNLWKEIDWFLAIFLLIECWHERLWENKFGPIHSYSFRLKGWDERAWERAWVNRIGLFLREWAAFKISESSEHLFGKKDEAEIKMTHDVDAIKKTWAIRFKQAVFILFNAFRALLNGNFLTAARKIKKSLIFLFTNENWMVFNKLLAYEKDVNVKSTFHFYGDLQKKNLKKMLIDPGYRINSNVLKNVISDVLSDNHEIGLHPSFESWNNIEDLKRQKRALEDASGRAIVNVRQHWLRFSWNSTWACQEAVGLKLDSTLMFNDRPGFRNSCSLVWHPWNVNKNQTHKIQAISSILMDSHIHDYLELEDNERENIMSYWIKECRIVSGKSAVLWHPHTLTKDYGWSDSFLKLLGLINRRSE